MKKLFVTIFILFVCMFGLMVCPKAESYHLPTITYPKSLDYNYNYIPINDEYSTTMYQSSTMTFFLNAMIGEINDNTIITEPFNEETAKSFTYYYLNDMAETISIDFLINGNIMKIGDTVFEVNYSGPYESYEKRLLEFCEDSRVKIKSSTVPMLTNGNYIISLDGAYSFITSKDENKLTLAALDYNEIMDILSLMGSSEKVERKVVQSNEFITSIGFYRLDEEDNTQYVMINFYDNNYVNIIINEPSEDNILNISTNKYYKINLPEKVLSSVNNIASYVKSIVEKEEKKDNYSSLDIVLNNISYNFGEDEEIKTLLQNDNSFAFILTALSLFDGSTEFFVGNETLPEMNLVDINEFVKELNYFTTGDFELYDSTLRLSYYFGDNKFYTLMLYDDEVIFKEFDKNMIDIFKDILTVGKKEEPKEEEIENPKTSDNIYYYLISGVISFSGLMLASLKIKKEYN